MYAKGMTDEQIAQQLFGQASPQSFTQKDPVIAISEFLTKILTNTAQSMRCMLKE
jgi:hypothetical protein